MGYPLGKSLGQTIRGRIRVGILPRQRAGGRPGRRRLLAAVATQDKQQHNTADHNQRQHVPAGEHARENVQDALGFGLRFHPQQFGRLGDAGVGQLLGAGLVAGQQGHADPLGVALQDLRRCRGGLGEHRLQQEEPEGQQ
jgi:hypothetical protein